MGNGPVGYFKSWIPDVPKGLYFMIVPLEILGQFMRLVSLSVRLFANMLAGHMLILTFIGLIFLTSVWVFPISIIFGTAFYLFEVAIVVSIQAFIFAALSAIYIGSAIEPEHQGKGDQWKSSSSKRRAASSTRARRSRSPSASGSGRSAPRLPRHRHHLRLDDPVGRTAAELRGELQGIGSASHSPRPSSSTA